METPLPCHAWCVPLLCPVLQLSATEPQRVQTTGTRTLYTVCSHLCLRWEQWVRISHRALCGRLKSRAQPSATSACLWSWPHRGEFMEGSVIWRKGKEECKAHHRQVLLLPSRHFTWKKRSTTWSHNWFQLLIAKCFPSPLCICYRCIIHIWMFPGIWFQRLEPVRFWDQTYSSGTPRELNCFSV